MMDLTDYVRKRPSERALFRAAGMVVRVRPKSIILFHDDTAQEVFIPRSVIQDWDFTDGRNSRGDLLLGDLEPNDQVAFVIPRWLARREGLE